MAGHSHASNVKYRKDRQDAKRGKVFTKIGKAISVAARSGGGDPDANPTLRLAIEKARLMNMPKDRIERAIAKATGADGEREDIDSLVYEGYGHGGTAILVEIATDNRNRIAGEIRNIFDKADCNLGTSGCVSYLFERRGMILISKDSGSEEKVMEVALESGADDVSVEDEAYEILTAPQNFYDVKQALESAGFAVEHSEVASIPSTWLDLSENDQRKLLKLIDALEDNDDVVNVYHNANLSQSVLQGGSGA